MMAVRYHGCTCHQRHSNAMALANRNNQDANGNAKDISKEDVEIIEHFYFTFCRLMFLFNVELI